MKRDKNHFRGCFLSGGIGNAMGCSVEFLKINENGEIIILAVRRYVFRWITSTDLQNS